MLAKKIFYIIIILTLVISCKKKKVDNSAQLNVKTVTDSTMIDSLGERISIHQQEWEEHQKELTDSLGVN